jgi:hypothetical protein
MASLNKQASKQTPAGQAQRHPACTGKSIDAQQRSSGDGKNQPFAMIAQIRPWNPVDRGP